MGRDVPIRDDDGIVVLLDTFLDRRNAYFFEKPIPIARAPMVM